MGEVLERREVWVEEEAVGADEDGEVEARLAEGRSLSGVVGQWRAWVMAFCSTSIHCCMSLELSAWRRRDLMGDMTLKQKFLSVSVTCAGFTLHRLRLRDMGTLTLAVDSAETSMSFLMQKKSLVQ
jgi:hypothetical protein